MLTELGVLDGVTEHVMDGVCDGVCDGVWLFGKDSFEECPLIKAMMVIEKGICIKIKSMHSNIRHPSLNTLQCICQMHNLQPILTHYPHYNQPIYHGQHFYTHPGYAHSSFHSSTVTDNNFLNYHLYMT